jgi:hypothetical protein
MIQNQKNQGIFEYNIRLKFADKVTMYIPPYDKIVFSKNK